MRAVRLALVTILILSTRAVGREPQIGDSVVVIAEQAEVKSKEGMLGTVPLGTQFSVKQKSGPWLLGLFQIEGRNVLGWVKPSSVRVMERDITQQPAHEFTWHNLLLACDKIDEDFTLEDYVDDYMRTVRTRVWEQSRNDEFQLERKRAETLAILKKRVAGFDLERDFMLKTTLTFESYDFKTNSFPIKEATENNYWYEYNYDGYSDALPTQLEVYLKDPKMIGGIPMAPNAAERFVAFRKSRYGSVDRKVYANIRLRITGVRSSDELESEVRWAQFFSDKNRTRLIYETPKSPIQVDVGEVSVNPTASLASVQATFAQLFQPTSPQSPHVQSPFVPAAKPSFAPSAHVQPPFAQPFPVQTESS